MSRTWKDELGRTWHVELDVPEISPDLEVGGGDAVLIFDAEGADERSIEVLGPIEEHLDALSDLQLHHALDAAGTFQGVILVDGDGHLWWARGPEADPRGGRWAVKFSDGESEHTHGGPLSDAPEHLSEDELLELLDEARGNVMEPMDVAND